MNTHNFSLSKKEIKIEIWSDVQCPWCYIGKRRFENALHQFEFKDHVKVEWKSFQLNPGLKTDPSKSIHAYLAEIKSCSLEEARLMNQNVSDIAKEAGLTYHFDKTIVANSFDAHRLIQLAKTKQKGDAAEEALFSAYFTQGKNIADSEVLISIGENIGLEPKELSLLLEEDPFSDEVKQDVFEARQIGINGVPFFLFNEKYAISGAQPSELFLETLLKSWKAL